MKKQFRALQFHYDMLRIEQADLAHLNPESPECQAYLDVDQRFTFLVSAFIIEPFASQLNADITQLFQELDLPDKYVNEVKRANQVTPRRNTRKPQTPVKITKEEIVPLSLNNTFLFSQQSEKRSVSRLTSSQRESGCQTDIKAIGAPTTVSQISSILGKRVQASQQPLESQLIQKFS